MEDISIQIDLLQKEISLIRYKEKELLTKMRKLQCLKTNKCSVEDIINMVQLG